jgi:hypothetical protein
MYVTSGMMREKSSADAARLWSKGVEHANKLTMGTILYTLFEKHGRDHVLSQLKLNSIESQLAVMRERLKMLRHKPPYHGLEG